MKLKSLRYTDEEVDDALEEADRCYLRTQMLLFCLLRYVPVFQLADSVSQASQLDEAIYLNELSMARLDSFIKGLSVELMSKKEDPKPEEPTP